MSVKTIEQSVPSGNNFTGAAPTVAPASVPGTDLLVSPIEAGDGAGEFDFEQTIPWVLVHVFIKLGGQGSYTISHVDRNNVVTDLFIGGSEDVFLANRDAGNVPAGLVFFEGEKIRVATTGTTTNNIIARLSADQLRS